MIFLPDLDIFSPVLDAITGAVGSLIAVIRAFLADTVGSVLVAVYTPFYCLLDYILLAFQLVTEILYTAFGWLPPIVFDSILIAFIMYIVAWIILTIISLIPVIGRK